MDEFEILLRAENTRRSWGFDNFTPLNILPQSFININNLSILFFPMEDGFRGCCSRTDEDNIVCINSNFSRGSVNFTLAHEIYHLLFNRQSNMFACISSSKQIAEIEADAFASYLLMPPVALEEFKRKNNIEEWSLEDVIRCEQYFQISHSALLKRLVKEDLISERFAVKCSRDILKKALNLGYSPELYLKSEKEYFALGKIVPLINHAYESDMISQSKRDRMLLNIFRGDIVYDLIEEDERID